MVATATSARWVPPVPSILIGISFFLYRPLKPSHNRPRLIGCWAQRTTRLGAATLLCLLLHAAVAVAQWKPLNPVLSVQQQADGAEFALKSGTLRIQICSDSIIRVVFSPPTSVAPPESLACLLYTSDAADE